MPCTQHTETPVGISLVICTRNRANRLAPCLERAVQQECSYPWEIILVDSASTDNTFETLTSWKINYPELLTVARAERPGLGFARKIGSDLARYPLIAFTDDDCYADKHFLEALVRTFGQYQQVGIISGRILLHDQADNPITTNDSIVVSEISARSIVPAGFVQGANMAIRADALRATGGFDSDLGAGTPFANEDLDIAGRLNAKGWHVLYEPSAVVWHHHGRKNEAEVRSLRATYDLGRGAYYAKMILSGHVRYLLYWAASVRHGRLGVLTRELKGALTYIRFQIVG